MGDIKKFPFEERQLERDVERIRQWAAKYERNPVQNDGDLFHRLHHMLAVVRLGMSDSLLAGTGLPHELIAAQGVILDALDYLPDRLILARALERYYPNAAEAVPKFPGWGSSEDAPGEDVKYD